MEYSSPNKSCHRNKRPTVTLIGGGENKTGKRGDYTANKLQTFQLPLPPPPPSLPPPQKNSGSTGHGPWATPSQPLWCNSLPAKVKPKLLRIWGGGRRGKPEPDPSEDTHQGTEHKLPQTISCTFQFWLL